VLLDSAHATFPGENGVIVFTSDFDDSLQRTSPKGGAPTVIAQHGDDPAVSPNGKKVAYTVPDERNNVFLRSLNGTRPALGVAKSLPWRSRIFIRSIDGTGPALDVTGSLPGSHSGPTWSPDGRKLAYINTRSDQPGIHTINADGTGDTWLITTNTLTLTGVAWSPRGDKIAFATLEQGLCVSTPDGTARAVVVPARKDQPIISVEWVQRAALSSSPAPPLLNRI
jgi:TolB protein